jgi:hypothetical protein
MNANDLGIERHAGAETFLRLLLRRPAKRAGEVQDDRQERDGLAQAWIAIETVPHAGDRRPLGHL